MTGICLNDITIRHTLRSGDLGEIVSMHGIAYHTDYGYDLHFESYVARGIHAFYEKYDPSTGRIRLCEHEDNLAGTCALQLKEAAIIYTKRQAVLFRKKYRMKTLGRRSNSSTMCGRPSEICLSLLTFDFSLQPIHFHSYLS